MPAVKKHTENEEDTGAETAIGADEKANDVAFSCLYNYAGLVVLTK